MSRVRGKDTGPEWRVRRFLYAGGFRYHLHVAELPGKPDIVFRGRRKVIFVHGCFWHRHPGCNRARLPKTRVDFWTAKLNGNAARDRAHQDALRKLGWDVLVLWECQTLRTESIAAAVSPFLADTPDRSGLRAGLL
jgi:DNA mismatch endonuclease, patch repair protein